MSDYPMLISNKLHSFRNFVYAKILYFSHNRPFVLQIFISLYIGCIAYEEKNIFGKVLLILRLYKYVYMCELTLFLINWQLCYP